MSCTGLLAPDRIAIAVGSAVALRCARSGPVAVVLLRSGRSHEPVAPAPPPTPSAVRVAGMLRSEGHPATARWRLVRSDVSSAGEAAEVLALLKSKEVPTVLCVSVRRSEAVQQLLAECIGVAAVAADEAGHTVARAAEAEGDGTLALLLPAAGAALVLPRAGIAAPPAWVEPIDQTVVMINDIAAAANREHQPLSAELSRLEQDFDGSIGVV